jgi:hypothetical protein
MKAERVKAEFTNLETHVGGFGKSKFKIKCDVAYEELVLTMQGEGKRVRVHARNIGNVRLEKEAVWISAMNFEIVAGGGDPSVVSGSMRLEFDDRGQAEAWFKELWS